MECAVSPEMVEEVRERESAAKATLDNKQARLRKLAADEQLPGMSDGLRTGCRQSALASSGAGPSCAECFDICAIVSAACRWASEPGFEAMKLYVGCSEVFSLAWCPWQCGY